MPIDNKARIVTDYDRLTEELKEQIKVSFPFGFSQHLITFLNKNGEQVKGLRFETDEKIYLVRMTILKAETIVSEDDDFDDDGNLIDSIKDEYEEKYADLDYVGDQEDLRKVLEEDFDDEEE